VSLACFFLNLEELSKIISLGNLLNFSFVNAGCIALRFREPQQHSFLVKKSSKEIYAWIYTFLAFLSAMSIGKNWDPTFSWVFGTLTIAAVIFMSTIPQINPPTGFACPLMPLTPCLGIFGNFFLISTIEFNIWIYFLVFEGFGLLFYLTYGLKHSQLNRLYE